jgi:hypothetical protein
MREKWVFSKKRRKDKAIFRPSKLLLKKLSSAQMFVFQKAFKNARFDPAFYFQGENSIFLAT